MSATERALYRRAKRFVRERWRAWGPPLILIPLLWSGLNAKLSAGASLTTGFSFPDLRALGPVICLFAGAVILYLFRWGDRAPRTTGHRKSLLPIILFAAIGLLGLTVGLLRSPDLLYSLEWGLAFLAVPVGFLSVYALSDSGNTRPALFVTGAIVAVITTVLFLFAVYRFDILSLGLDQASARPFVYRDYEPITDAFLINANGAARFAAVTGLTLLAIGLCARRVWTKVVTLIPFGLLGAMIIATQSRSGLIGFMVASGAVLLLTQGIRRTIVVGVGGAIALAAAGALEGIISALSRAGIQDLWTFGNRVPIWAPGFEAFWGNFLFGAGFQTDRLLLNEHLHQAWLQTGLQTGIVGLLLMIAAWALVARSVYRVLQHEWEDFDPFDRTAFVASVGVLVFFLLRSIPESTGAFYGVDLLILIPVFGFIWDLEARVKDTYVADAPRWSNAPATPSPAERRSVLVCAFACRPPDSPDFEGGEDLLGWSLVRRLSRHHDLHVITQERNRESLEQHRGVTANGSLSFEYVDVDIPFVDRDRESSQGLHHLYAYAWQVKARSVAERLHEKCEFDLFHHLTYANDWMASHAGAALDIPYVRGPGGSGPSIPLRYLRDLPIRGAVWESIRMAGRHPFRWDPWFIASQRKAERILVCNREAMRRLPPSWAKKAEYFPVMGAPELHAKQPSTGPGTGNGFTVVSAGKLLPAKGFGWAIQGFSRFHKETPGSQLVIVGDGPDRGRLEEIAERHGVRDAVTFKGWLPQHSDVLEQMRQGDVFLYPSLFDGGGAVVVEAMQQGLPIITMDAGGPAIHVDEKSGFRLRVTHPERTISDIAERLLELHQDPGLYASMSKQAKNRAMTDYRWDLLAQRMLEVYDEVLYGQSAGAG